MKIELSPFELEVVSELVSQTVDSLFNEGREESPEFKAYSQLNQRLAHAAEPSECERQSAIDLADYLIDEIQDGGTKNV